MSGEIKKPSGEPALRTMAMPADTNPAGDIFGGWLLSQMDLAGGMVSRQRARGRTATVALDSMVFHKPVQVGDAVSCYARVETVGLIDRRTRKLRPFAPARPGRRKAAREQTRKPVNDVSGP